MFGALFYDRDPLRASDIPAGILAWIPIVGGFALFGVLLFLVLGLPRWKKRDFAAVPAWQKLVFLGGAGLALICYAVGAIIASVPRDAVAPLKPGEMPPDPPLATTFYLIGGLGALAAGLLAFLVNLPAFRLRRIMALASLSFKEAIRRRVLVVFASLLVVILFGSWFIKAKPEDQLRTYVGVWFFAMSVLLLFASALIAAFSIPADIRQQTIHTIVTKPVERFEIALGRFLGFYALMTLILLAISSLGLLYILRGIDPEAVAESLKAREPHYGELRFLNTEKATGANVGREWEYRGYITASPEGQPVQAAVWDFAAVPAVLGSYKQVAAEYTFDVYRTTKGKEGADPVCDFVFTTAAYAPGNEKLFQNERKAGDADLDDQLAEKYGYFEVRGKGVTDYKTMGLRVPGGLFRSAAKAGGKGPALTLKVTTGRDANTSPQYIGMAKFDFYFRLDTAEASTALFALNYYKAVFGLWLQIGLIIGLCVVLSTYLNGIITLLVALCLFLGGTTRDFVKSVAEGTNVGGGPLEAIRTITSRQVVSAKTTDSESAADLVVNRSDAAFRWVVRRILNVLPDVDRFNMERNLAEGFNIPLGQMLATFLLLVGYLVPWFVLAYYLLRWREVASST